MSDFSDSDTALKTPPALALFAKGLKWYLIVTTVLALIVCAIIYAGSTTEEEWVKTRFDDEWIKDQPVAKKGLKGG